MKKVILIWMAIVVASTADPASAKKPAKHNYKNERLCKIFKQKIVTYKKEMRDDEYARATLESYKKRAAMFCGK